MVKTINTYKKELKAEDVITFEDGLIGLSHLKKYVLLDSKRNLPFKYLQSVDDESIALMVINSYLYLEDYSFDIYEYVIDELEIEKASDILVLSVVVIPKEISKMTANFAAPILININNRKAKQIILSEPKYEIRFPIYDKYIKLISQEGE